MRFAIVKIKTELDFCEARDIAGHTQTLMGKTTVEDFKTFNEALMPPQHIGLITLTLGADDKCPEFLAFMERQANRLKFNLGS